MNLEDIEDKMDELALNNPKSNFILTEEKAIINDIIKDSANNNLINPLVIDSSDGFNAINDTSLKELSDTLENVVFLLKDSIQKAPDSLQNEMVELYDSMKVEKKIQHLIFCWN